ncbi:MAG: GAF domain-containing protein, partial [Actinomycetota bacterium]
MPFGIYSLKPGRRNTVGKGFRALKLLGFLVPLAFILLLEAVRVIFLDGMTSRRFEAVIAVGLLALGAIIFSRAIFTYIDGVHGEVSRRSEQLATLYKTGVAINSTLGLKDTIQLIIDEARVLLKATAGELVLSEPVLDMEGSGHAVYFSGFNPEGCEVASRPHMGGLNGEVLKNGKPLRVDHRVDHPGSVALPAGHLEFDSVLSVPLTNTSGNVLGCITLIKQMGEPPFSSDDEALLVSF